MGCGLWPAGRAPRDCDHWMRSNSHPLKPLERNQHRPVLGQTLAAFFSFSPPHDSVSHPRSSGHRRGEKTQRCTPGARRWPVSGDDLTPHRGPFFSFSFNSHVPSPACRRRQSRTQGPATRVMSRGGRRHRGLSLCRSRIRLSAPPFNGFGCGAQHFSLPFARLFFVQMPQLVHIWIERNCAAVTATLFAGKPVALR